METEVSSSMESIACLICGDSSRGVHVGVDSCRACAAFFRRIAVVQKEYSCKGVAGKRCFIPPRNRKSCKKCRYERCLEVGMSPEAFNIQVRLPDHPEQSFPKQSDSLLMRIATSFEEMRADRRLIELRALPIEDNDTSLIHIRDGVLRKMDDPKIERAIIAGIPMMTRFLRLLLPDELNILNDSITRFHFAILVMFFDSGTSTARTQITSTGYIDIEKREEEILPGPDGMARKGIRKLVKERESSRIQDEFRRLQLDDVERAAYLAICVWNNASFLESASHEVVEYCREQRKTILRDIHFYYSVSKRIVEYSARIGEIMSLPMSIQYIMQSLKEEAALQSAFIPEYGSEYKTFVEQW